MVWREYAVEINSRFTILLSSKKYVPMPFRIFPLFAVSSEPDEMTIEYNLYNCHISFYTEFQL